MLFGKKKKKEDIYSEYYKLLRRFDEVLKKPDLTTTELNKQYNLLLKPALERKLTPVLISALDFKHTSGSSDFKAACEAREKNYYRTFYRLSPGYRNKRYAEIINYYNNWYELMKKKENQNNPEKRKKTDTLLKKGYNHLCTELYRYGKDQKYLELHRAFYKLRNFYYNDLNGKKYYRVTLGYYEIPNIFDLPPEAHYCDEVIIQDRRTFFVNPAESTKKRIVNYHVPIYAVDDEQGLHDVITGEKVYHLTNPAEFDSRYIWYTKLEPEDQYTVALKLSFLGDDGFIICNKDYKSRYQKEVHEAQIKCKECFVRDYKSAIEKQKEDRKKLEKELEAIANTKKILNKNL